MKSVTTLLFVLFTLGLLAQVDSVQLQKRWLVGGNGQIYLEKIGANTGRLIAIVEPQGAYFFTNSWMAGLRAPMSFKSNEYKIAVVPFVRYYVPIKGHVRPFFELNFGHDWRVIINVSDTPNNLDNSWLYGARAGGAFFLNQHVSIDLFLYYTGQNSRYKNGATGEVGEPLLKQYFGVGAGFQIYL